MSTPFTPIISINPSHVLSTRYLEAADDLNQYANDPKYGGSVQDIKEIAKGLALKSATDNTILGDPAPDDLVGRLMKDEKEVWDKLLKNTFCLWMATAKREDERETKGFKWYMIQDFFYCTNFLIYDTERANKSRNAKEFEQSIKKISSHAGYAGDIFGTCTKALGLKEDVVLTAKKEPALLAYLKGGQEIATSQKWNWITTLVFMIPCIQSYYLIAKNLKDTRDIPKDTLWYQNWIEPNSQYEASTVNQRSFFKAAWKDWEANYDELRLIFRQACQYEIGLWAVGENPGPVS